MFDKGLPKGALTECRKSRRGNREGTRVPFMVVAVGATSLGAVVSVIARAAPRWAFVRVLGTDAARPIVAAMVAADARM